MSIPSEVAPVPTWTSPPTLSCASGNSCSPSDSREANTQGMWRTAGPTVELFGKEKKNGPAKDSPNISLSIGSEWRQDLQWFELNVPQRHQKHENMTDICSALGPSCSLTWHAVVVWSFARSVCFFEQSTVSLSPLWPPQAESVR